MAAPPSRGPDATRRDRRARDRGTAATGTRPRTPSARARRPGAGAASRVGYADRRQAQPGQLLPGACVRPTPRPRRGGMFAPVPTRPDLVAMEHEVLALWRERRTFARLRAQNAGGPRWSFLDGPITANNPMGVHHAWGRAYKDVYQRYHAMLGENQRWQNGFDCQGLWIEVNVERDLGFKSKRDIEVYGIAPFVILCKQRVLNYAAVQTQQSIRLGMWMDWNKPETLLWLRDELGKNPQ